MKVHYGFDSLGTINKPVVTTGSFDGVHLGHKAILNRIIQLAGKINGESVLITFHPHPRKVLYPDTAGKDLKFILSQREKIELLGKTGLQHLIIVEFTLDFSKISSNRFILDFLIAKLHARYIVVGFNHHFGHNREGDYDELKALGRKYHFEVEEIPEQDIKQETVSSTTIRKALLQGKIQRANAYLDHHYLIIGPTRELPSRIPPLKLPAFLLIIEEPEKLIPPGGIYAATLDASGKSYRAMVVIRNVHSHIGGYARNVEVYIVDHDRLRYPPMAILYFHKRIADGVESNPSRFAVQLIDSARHIAELII